MGIRLDEPFPLYPRRVPARDHGAVRGGDRPAGPGQRAGVGHRDHRGARRGAPRDRSAHRLHERRLRVPDRDAQGRGAAADALRVVPDRAPAPHRRARRRPRDRPAVRGAARGVRAPARASRLRRAAAGADGARPPASTPASPSTASARSATSSPARASPRGGTRTRTTTASTSRSSTSRRPAPAFVFTNLVDFDSKYGHRNDPAGYAAAIEAFDRRLPELIGALDGGVLFITGDHGCDPTTPSTDHTRERTPLLAAGLSGGPLRDRDAGLVRRPRAHGRRSARRRGRAVSIGSSFADLGCAADRVGSVR